MGEQMLKLKKELSEGKKEVEGMRTDIKDMENNLHQQEIIMKSQPHDKKAHVEARQLETDISGLRGVCDDMSKRVHTMTAGKVPLGETSIKFENYLTPALPAQPPEQSRAETTWPCSECT